MIVFGLIGLLLQTRFPIFLGTILFFTDGEFIEWVLQKISIRLEPDTLGAEFIKSFVLMFGYGILLAYWKDSAPARLSTWMPPDGSWSFIAAIALLVAVVAAISAAIMRRDAFPPPRSAITLQTLSKPKATIFKA
ncbi:hypothetical protein IVB22_32230 [Bradyrhizobium sp. 190]|uniref:hypothetical protein n=1 Tax=Bradyrhizobium sp. 190 TaxID=2782658 RepID=UPI001FFBDDEF|nr:hypothetical protein [Bradyrhizobium sp. 190]MCK1517092.1 hypothetical protein [Bradyrhizobium sp. 190]